MSASNSTSDNSDGRSDSMDEIIANELLKEQMQNHIFNEMHKQLVSLYQTKKLIPPTPLWHLSADQIPYFQFVNLSPKLRASGLTVIPQVDVNMLISLMPDGDQIHYSKKKLYNSSNDERRTSRIIYHWQKAEKLTPPTMIVFDAECVAVMGLRPGYISPELRPVDGKHRLNAACSIGVKTIPIVVRTPQVSLIKQMLVM